MKVLVAQRKRRELLRSRRVRRGAAERNPISRSPKFSSRRCTRFRNESQRPFQRSVHFQPGADGHTRLTPFVAGVALEPTDVSVVNVRIENSQQEVIELASEAPGRVKHLSWISQVILRLPDSLANLGNVNVRVSVRGVVSKKPRPNRVTPLRKTYLSADKASKI
jgi:hypothetical protein